VTPDHLYDVLTTTFAKNNSWPEILIRNISHRIRNQVVAAVRVAAMQHNLVQLGWPFALLLREVVVPPDQSLVVEFVNLFVNQLIRILTLVQVPACLHKHAISIGLLLSAVLSHCSTKSWPASEDFSSPSNSLPLRCRGLKHL
jgi:hypothetical protein